jgi:hypothetical protein
MSFCPEIWKCFQNVFQVIVSNISMEEHAHLAPFFVLVLIWIITAYLLKLYHSATVPLCDTIVLSWACHVLLTSIDVSKGY